MLLFWSALECDIVTRLYKERPLYSTLLICSFSLLCYFNLNSRWTYLNQNYFTITIRNDFETLTILDAPHKAAVPRTGLFCFLFFASLKCLESAFPSQKVKEDEKPLYLHVVLFESRLAGDSQGRGEPPDVEPEVLTTVGGTTTSLVLRKSTVKSSIENGKPDSLLQSRCIFVQRFCFLALELVTKQRVLKLASN